MKFSPYLSFLILLLFSCSSDEGTSPDLAKDEDESINKDIQIVQWVSKYYNFSGTSGSEQPVLGDSLNFSLAVNRITGFSGLISMHTTPSTLSGDFTYNGDQLVTFVRKVDGKISYQMDLGYNSSGDLITHLQKDWNDNSQSFNYYKEAFTYKQDTIYSEQSTSSDGINYTTQSNEKIVLDENDNRIYLENNYNGSKRVIRSTYEHNNLTYTSIYENTVYSYGYTDYINLESLVFRNTFGKKVYSLIYGEGHAFGPKTLSKNILASSTGGNTSLEYITQVNSFEDSFATSISYTEKSGDIIYELETSEFEIQHK